MSNRDDTVWLVEGERITEVEIAPGGYLGEFVQVRRVGDTGPYRTVYSIQCHETEEEAKADVARFREGGGLPKVTGKPLDGFRKRKIIDVL